MQPVHSIPVPYCVPTVVCFVVPCRPDLLLVERSVARSAQEELLARGISLVQHTKPEMLERLGRCMGVKVRVQPHFLHDGTAGALYLCSYLQH